MVPYNEKFNPQSLAETFWRSAVVNGKKSRANATAANSHTRQKEQTMYSGRHETFAAMLLSGALIFAGASFAAGVGGNADIGVQTNPGGAPAADIGAAANAPVIPPPTAPAPSFPSETAIPNPAAPDAAPADTIKVPNTLNAPAEPVAPPPAADAAGQTLGNTAAQGPISGTATASIEGLGKRSVDTSKMSRRQAERTEQRITKDLNRASAAGTGNANATTQAGASANSKTATP
jgi:hypothetical protein